MRSKRADVKKKLIENWNKQPNPRVRPVAAQIERIKAEKKLDAARAAIEFRRNVSERDQLINQGIIKPSEVK
jgi:hypothetical protein